MRLIDADKTKQVLRDRLKGEYSLVSALVENAIVNLLDEQPTADVEKLASDAYKEGWSDALEGFVINLIGDMDAYESNGHNLDVKAWARNYVQVMKHEVE